MRYVSGTAAIQHAMAACTDGSHGMRQQLQLRLCCTCLIAQLGCRVPMAQLAAKFISSTTRDAQPLQANRLYSSHQRCTEHPGPHVRYACRTTEVHKTQLRQKELEVEELQRVVAAKEWDADALRQTLSTTKRSYEQRLSQLEAQLSSRDAEV